MEKVEGAFEIGRQSVVDLHDKRDFQIATHTAPTSRIGILFQGATRAVAFDGNEHGKTSKKGEPILERGALHQFFKDEEYILIVFRNIVSDFIGIRSAHLRLSRLRPFSPSKSALSFEILESIIK